VASLIVIGLLAGAITAISPCVLPVLPILLAGSATGPPRRPYAIVAGLVASFTVFTLFAATLLDALGLPDDFLRNLALVLLFVLAATLVFPRLGELVSTPLSRLARRPAGDLGGGFLLGASLGLVFVPCAGPVLAAVAVIAAEREVGLDAFVLTLAYAVGAGLPMLAVALAGQRALTRTKAVQARAATVRRGLGVVIGAAALAIALDFDRPFQTSIPGYTAELQEQVEESASAEHAIERVTGRAPAPESPDLQDLGPAPEFVGISRWINTEERPLSLARLRGKVVLVDIWTYSCINCLRTLPHLKSWYERYRSSGLEIVGVHSPEFAFERVPENVKDAVASLEIEYPVALDNDFATWQAYDNQYWPAKYLIDRDGRIRYYHFGEGEYTQTEGHIRTLLAERGGSLPARAAPAGDATPRALITPELYLGYQRATRFVGSAMLAPDRASRYELPGSLPESSFAFGGRWRVERERVVAAGRDASLLLRFRAAKVHLVLGGRGQVEIDFRGRKRTIRVARDRLYTLLTLPRVSDGLLALRFTRGVEAYAFTFGADVSGKRLGARRRGVGASALEVPVGFQRSLAPA
jgi:cytochrome c biogenesis protein CcdA/thiol-disulfide isomerase/thioredoxin